MDVLYYSTHRHLEVEGDGVSFMEKERLLKESDIITLQTPKNVKILAKSDFRLMVNKILINTTLGQPFDVDDFVTWLQQ